MAIQTYIISKKQSLLDACIQVYGTSKLLFQFAKDNGLQIDSAVNIGDSLLYDDELGDQDLKNKIEGEGFIINNPGAELLPETIALINRMDIKPDPNRIWLINSIIYSLIESGLWDKLDVLYFFNAHDQQAGNLNWKSVNYTAVPVNSPLFSIDLGYTGDGVSSYLDTGFAPSDGVNFTLNNSGFGAYVEDEIIISDLATLMGCYRTSFNRSTVQIIPNYLQDFYYTNNSIDNSLDVIAGIKKGLYASYRNDFNSVKGYINLEQYLEVRPSSFLHNFPFFILCRNFEGAPQVFFDKTVSVAFTGANFTEDEHAIFLDIINNYRAQL